VNWTSQLAAQHSALWGFDRWYRLWWYIWPASLALLVVGWICIDKPTGVTLPSGSWATPVGQGVKATQSAPPNPLQVPFANCFSNQIMRGTAIYGCTALINSLQISGRQLASVLIQRGFLQRETEPDKAIADYDAALKARPDVAEAFDGRAWIYMTRGNYEAAVSDLNKAIELLPSASAGIWRGAKSNRLRRIMMRR
jgi:tetratricopeptide (TPR) repeat protein